VKGREKDGTAGWFGLPRWIALFLAATVVVGAGFLLWLTAQAFSRSSTLDARRVRALNIAADYIAKWPTAATTIGQGSLYHRSQATQGKAKGGGNVFHAYLYHPEFGAFQVEYDRGKRQCDRTLDIEKNRLTVSGEALGSSNKKSDPEKTYIERARKASWIRPRTKMDPICFKVANLDLGRVAPSLRAFSHLLLIEDPRGSEENGTSAETKAKNGNASWRDGRVVAWVGPFELPIRRLSDLPALENELPKVVVKTAEAAYTASTKQAAIQGDPRATDALEPFDSRIAGKSYRFYWRPIVFELPADSAKPSQEPKSYYLVGVAPSRAAPEPGRTRTEILVFAFALFMLVALMPVVKLALLGPVDSMKTIEVTAICLGIVAAAALGVALWIGVQDVLVARNATSLRVRDAAASLVGNIDKGLHDALLSPEMDELSENLGTRSNELVTGWAPTRETYRAPPVAKVENLLLLDANGRQAAGTIVRAARDNVGSNFDLSDRSYFKRVMDGDFAPHTEPLADAMKQGGRSCSIWNDVEGGLVFEQVRSRADGAPKTIVAAKLRHPAQSLRCGPGAAGLLSKDERLQPSAIVAVFVMSSMLSPSLDPDVRYAVVDARNVAGGRPVLFHSDSYRAGVELFDESLNASTRARLSDELRDPLPCRPSTGATGDQPRRFTGIYEEEATLFAAARVPCTDWAVIAFKSRRLVDSQAVKPALHAMVVWASLAIFPYLLWMGAAALLGGDRAWVWLWPEPTSVKKRAYLMLSLMLAGADIIGVLLVAFAAPFAGLLLCAFFAVAAIGWLVWLHYEQEFKAWLRRVRSARADGAQAPPEPLGPRAVECSKGALDRATEWRFTWLVIALLIAVSGVPIAALAADARGYFAQVSEAEREAGRRVADQARVKSWTAIARMEGLKTEQNDGQPSTDEAQPGHTPPAPPRPQYFTERVRQAAGYELGLALVAAPPTHWLLGRPYLGSIDRFTLFALALVIGMILYIAIWATLWGLFGFGVALEAVEYPTLKVKRDGKGGWVLRGKLPARFLVIRAEGACLKALKRGAFNIDLNEEIRTGRRRLLPQADKEHPKLILIHNLGLLLGDPDGRRKALERLEEILARQFDKPNEEQDQGPDDRANYRIAMLTSLTPLERLLQSFERERDESDQLDKEQQTASRLARAKYREDMRWSAVFEEFKTYFHAARPRWDPPGLELAGDVVRWVWWELRYIPDAVVAAMIWDSKRREDKKPTLKEEILIWAGEIEKFKPERRAIADHLASSLIEHYHLMWSLSSRAERLLLYRIAHGHVPNVAKAYALRSLVKRGLVVLDPYPRTMNDSFAQFVMHVEKPETIKNWRRTQESGFWEGARLLFGLVLPLALGVLILAAIRNGDSIASIVPLIIAAGPALINALGAARRTAAA
jgi:hypothetical protein